MARRRTHSDSSRLAVLLVILALGFFAFRLPGFAFVLGTFCLIMAFVVTAVTGWVRTRDVRRWHSIGSLYALSPTDFERHVAEMYRHLGFSTQTTPRVGDQGVDILARRGSDVIAIQCKRYADRAANSAVQAVHAGRAHYGCNQAIVICLGGFSTAARQLAESTGVALIDGKQYADMMARVGPRAAANYSNFIPRGRSLLYVTGLVIVALLGFAVGARVH